MTKLNGCPWGQVNYFVELFYVPELYTEQDENISLQSRPQLLFLAMN